MLETTKTHALKGWLVFIFDAMNWPYNLFFYNNKLNFTIIIARNSDNFYVLFLCFILFYVLFNNCLLHGTNYLELFQFKLFSPYLQFKMFP